MRPGKREDRTKTCAEARSQRGRVEEERALTGFAAGQPLRGLRVSAGPARLIAAREAFAHPTIGGNQRLPERLPFGLADKPRWPACCMATTIRQLRRTLLWENDEVARQLRDRVAVAPEVLQDSRGIDGQTGEAIGRHQQLALIAPGALTTPAGRLFASR